MSKAIPATAIATLLFAFALVAGQAWAADGEKKSEPNAVGANSGWSAQIARDNESGITLANDQNETVKAISDYFSALTTLKGRFVQTGADNKVMKGKFKIMRPGMFRFDYARPSLQVIISDGEYLAIQDHDIGNEQRIAIDQTPFRILLRKNVDLTRDARILAVRDTGDTLYLALEDKNPESPGVIKLTFTKTPKIELAEWITTDIQGLDTRVQVMKLVHGEKIEAKEFVIKAPERRFLP